MRLPGHIPDLSSEIRSIPEDPTPERPYDEGIVKLIVLLREGRQMITSTKEVVLEPEAQAFADATSKPPFVFDLSPEKGRAGLNDVQSAPVDKLPVDVDDLVIEGGPGGRVSIRILRPLNAPA